MQPEGKFCQSCGMPLIKKEDHGTEADHTQSEKYCHYCYKDGKFTGPDITQEEMIEISAKGWAESDPSFNLGKHVGEIKAWCEAAKNGAKKMSLSNPFYHLHQRVHNKESGTILP